MDVLKSASLLLQSYSICKLMAAADSEAQGKKALSY